MKRKQPKKATKPPEIEWGECPECGHETGWMGYGVRCEDCGEASYIPKPAETRKP